MEIKLTSNIENDKYTEYVYDAFDIQDTEQTNVTITYDISEADKFDWNIGIIYGSSGSGKTSILKSMGNLSTSNFDRTKSLISNFDWLEPAEVTRLLTSMGLSSVPTWLRPYNLLSNGEQYRAELAYKVAKAKEGETILIDEYTSVVDRDVAKSMSFALQKYIRKTNKKIILASCHYDIMEWLMPDWTCAPQKGGTLERGDWLRQGKPHIELQVSRVEPRTWDFFKDHHYLTEKVNQTGKFFLFEWNSKPVGIVVMLNSPGKDRPNAFSISRTVVLPDFQGMGIGSKISEFCAAIYVANGGRVYTKTINPALGEYRSKSDKFKPTPYNGKTRTALDKKARNRLTRASYCYEYIGKGLSGYEELLLPVSDARIKKTESGWAQFL